MITKNRPKLFVVAVFMLGVAQHAMAQTSVMNGNLKGLKAKQVKFLYMDGDARVMDSAKVVDGKFSWKSKIKEPQEVYLNIAKKYYPFFIDKGTMTLTGLADSTQTFAVKGSKMQDQSEAYKASIKDITAQEEPLMKRYQTADDAEKKSIEAEYSKLSDQKNARSKVYISANPGNNYSVYLLSQMAAAGTDYSDVKKLYDQLTTNAKQTSAGRGLAARLDILKRGALGAQFIDFAQPDTTGNVVHYSDFKGKYVLVDFWASWCGPCRAENPNVLKAYEKYKDKNFTIVGVSLDDKATNWKKAVITDKLPWTQLSDLKGWQNELSTYYGIQGIPCNFLLDPSGKIIAKDIRGEALHQKLGEVLN